MGLLGELDARRSRRRRSGAWSGGATLAQAVAMTRSRWKRWRETVRWAKRTRSWLAQLAAQQPVLHRVLVCRRKCQCDAQLQSRCRVRGMSGPEMAMMVRSKDPLLTPRNQAQAAILAAPRHPLTQISRGIGGIRGCSWLGPCICPNHPSPSSTVTRPTPLLSQTVTLHNPNPLSITRSGLLLGSTLILLK